MKYHVTYYAEGLGAGTEVSADYGIVEGGSQMDAKLYIAWRETENAWKPTDMFPTRRSFVEWMLGCLTAREVKE